MSDRPDVPEALKRAVLIEAGHRCAIPTCRFTRCQIAHIVPWKECQEHRFENLIALCPNCHVLYDIDKKIDRKSMVIYKQNLALLNYRYGDCERRILQFFAENPTVSNIKLPGWNDIHIFYLLKDGFLTLKSVVGIFFGGMPAWAEYELTQKGRDFVENWKTGRMLSSED
jgi:hypothetical protein